MAGNQQVGARLRVVVAPGVGIGPGKAAILEGIRETGSIAAAGRRIGMSYKRAWLIVAALNAHFDTPLIDASKGGKAGGGAQLTALGEEVLAAYREMLALTDAAIAQALARIARRVATGNDARSEPHEERAAGAAGYRASGPRKGRGTGRPDASAPPLNAAAIAPCATSAPKLRRPRKA